MKKIVYLLSIGLIFTLLGCGTSVATKETPDTASMKATAQAPLSSKNEPNMSMDEFEQIKNGIAYEQVTAIVGSPGEIIVEQALLAIRFTRNISVQRRGKYGGNSNAQLTFQGGKLTTKAQMGIKRYKYEEIG